MSATANLPLRKRIILIGSSVLLLGGGARLAYDEVRIASETAHIRGLEEKAALADQDRRRVIQLERHLGDERTKVRGLEGEVDRRQREHEALQAKLAQTRRELEDEIVRTRQELLDRLKAVETAAAQAKASADAEIARLEGARSAAQRLAEERAQSIAQLESRAQQLQASLETSQTTVRTKDRELATARTRIAAGERRAATLEAEVAGMEKDLARLQGRLDEGKDLVRRLEAAGVNVARLTGERPMPSLTAVVVRVDIEALPLEVLVDVGSASGVELGDRLYVVREGREVARLEVTEVLGNASRARLVHGVRGLELRSGDDVTSVKPSTTPQ